MKEVSIWERHTESKFDNHLIRSIWILYLWYVLFCFNNTYNKIPSLPSSLPHPPYHQQRISSSLILILFYIVFYCTFGVLGFGLLGPWVGDGGEGELGQERVRWGCIGFWNWSRFGLGGQLGSPCASSGKLRRVILNSFS